MLLDYAGFGWNEKDDRTWAQLAGLVKRLSELPRARYFPVRYNPAYLVNRERPLSEPPGGYWTTFGKASTDDERLALLKRLEDSLAHAVQIRDVLAVNVIWMSIGQSVNDRNPALYSELSTRVLSLLDSHPMIYSYADLPNLEHDGSFERPAIKLVSVSEQLAKEVARNPTVLHEITSRGFEELLADVFRSFDYDVELTAKTRDGGRDIIAIGNTHDVKSKLLIECKRYAPENKVDVVHVRALFGVKHIERATKALLATTSSFTEPAREIERQNIYELELKDYNAVLEWIRKFREIRGL
jgi:hypothetical protein